MPLSDLTPAQIKALREGMHLSQVEFAERVGVSERTVQNWEAGARPRPSHRRALLALTPQEAA